MDDLISRKAAINAIMDADVCVTWNGVISDDDAVDIAIKSTKGSVISSIVNMPSAEPDSKELSSTHKALDTISRQAAIRWVKTECNPYGKPTLDFESGKKVIEHLKQMPSAQPETHEERTETHACDCIERQAAINALTSHIMPHNNEDGTVTIGVLSKSSIKNILNKLPSAQPDLSGYSDKLWKAAYERGKAEAQQRWIPFKRRKPTEEEGTAFDYIMDCKCPEDGQNILVSINIQGHEPVQYDTFYGGGGEECCLESGYELVEEAIAWMPLPEPYAERRTDERRTG